MHDTALHQCTAKRTCGAREVDYLSQVSAHILYDSLLVAFPSYSTMGSLLSCLTTTVNVPLYAAAH